jgi:hypothetical protein
MSRSFFPSRKPSKASAKELLRQKEAAIKAFDEKLAKLGHHEGARASKRNHHKHDGEKKTG